MTSTRSEELGLRVLEAINARDYDRVDELTTEQVQLRMPPGEVFFGRAGLRDFFAQVEARLPALTLVARKIHAGEDFAVIEYDTTGHTRSHPGAEVLGMGCLVLELDGGERVDRVQLYVDTAQWQQIASGEL
jgi:ketosteroid isomerase-like protein